MPRPGRGAEKWRKLMVVVTVAGLLSAGLCQAPRLIPRGCHPPEKRGHSRCGRAVIPIHSRGARGFLFLLFSNLSENVTFNTSTEWT